MTGTGEPSPVPSGTPVRIGNASGFYGDRESAVREMLTDGELDYLTGDYLAELTMLILAMDRLKAPERGYARSFLRQMEECLGLAVDSGVKVVVNAGGLNPAGLADALREQADRLGVAATVAHVEGDDLLPRAGELGLAGQAGASPLAANAYLGAWGIVEALRSRADVVVTGRVTDASLVVGPAAHHFDWRRDHLDQLAGAVAAGHVIECGTQATGGNFAGFTGLVDHGADMTRPGFPIAEVFADGSSVITKHPGTGGAVTVDTVTAQLLYEIGGPRYAGPDVTTRFDTLTLEQVGADRVRISGAAGEPPPPTLKVGVNAMGGYRNEVVFVLTGLDIEAKADLVRGQMAAAGFGPTETATGAPGGTGEERTVEKSAGGESAGGERRVEARSVEARSVAERTVEESRVEARSVEERTVEESAVEESAVEEGAVERSGGDESAGGERAVEESAGGVSAGGVSTVGERSGEARSVEERTVGERTERGPEPDAQVHVRWTLARTDHPDATTEQEASALLHCVVRSSHADAVGRRFSNAAIELALASYPGFHVTAPPSNGSPYGVFTAAYVDAAEVPHVVVLADGTRIDVAPAGPDTRELEPVPEPVLSPGGGTDDQGHQNSDGVVSVATRRLPLGSVALARSGDKGGSANIGVWATSEERFTWLADTLTVERLRELLPETADLEVTRHPLPNLRALNFVVEGILGEGVSSNARFDPQAKALGEWLRARHVEVPTSLIPEPLL